MLPIFDKLSAWGKVILLVLLIFMGAIISTGLGLITIYLFYGSTVAHTLLGGLITCDNCLAPLKILQIFNHIGLFAIPAIAWIILTEGKIREPFALRKSIHPHLTLITITVVFTIAPLIAWVSEFNQAIHIPVILESVGQWMHEKEAAAEKITDFFMRGASLPGLGLNLIMMAILPALGEELLFRGLIQRQLSQRWNNPHLAIFISAAIFSAIHFQFFGFLPRMLLGILFGYLLLFSGNLWYPILAHFINNATAVMVFYFHDTGQSQTPMEDFGKLPGLSFIISSALITIILLLLFYRKGKESIA
jgi:membrane protease YdiL (CAAX protease family)